LVLVTAQPIVFFPLTSIERSVTIDSCAAQEKFLLELRGGGYDISEAIIKMLLIWTISQNCKPTDGFQIKPTNPHLESMGQKQPNPRIAPKVREQHLLQA
jgi:hypothetical protein